MSDQSLKLSASRRGARREPAQKGAPTWPYLLLGGLLFALGALTLYHLVNNVWLFDVELRLDVARAIAQQRSDPATLWSAALPEVILVFLVAILLSAQGLSLPVVHFLNRRFGHSKVPRFVVTFRQSLWFGLWLVILTLLAMNRALGPAVALLLAVVLVIFELLLLARYRARAV